GSGPWPHSCERHGGDELDPRGTAFSGCDLRGGLRPLRACAGERAGYTQRVRSHHLHRGEQRQALPRLPAGRAGCRGPAPGHSGGRRPGRSNPIGSTAGAITGLESVGEDASAIAEALACFRADSIVEDAEILRGHLGADTWSLLGQSFGGFTALRYVSEHASSLREV